MPRMVLEAPFGRCVPPLAVLVSGATVHYLELSHHDLAVEEDR